MDKSKLTISDESQEMKKLDIDMLKKKEPKGKRATSCLLALELGRTIFKPSLQLPKLSLSTGQFPHLENKATADWMKGILLIALYKCV